MPANSRGTVRLKLSGYGAPSDLLFELDGEQDNGLPFISKAIANIRR
jgi:hypothetical protein